MRAILTWLMVFGVLGGLNARVLAADAGHMTACPVATDSCCHEAHDSDAPVAPHSDDGHCPQDHHHHSGCCSPLPPLVIDHNIHRQLGIPGSSRSGIRHECEIAPDGPYLSSEKPPLI